MPPSLLGESPFWHPAEQVLYWCDIPGHALNRFDPKDGAHRVWPFATDVACCSPLMEGGLLLALRSGLVRFDTHSGKAEPLQCDLPYDPKTERFNDGKADAQGRLWVGTIYEPREPAKAALYRYAGGKLDTSGTPVGAFVGRRAEPLHARGDGQHVRPWRRPRRHRLQRDRDRPGGQRRKPSRPHTPPASESSNIVLRVFRHHQQSRS